MKNKKILIVILLLIIIVVGIIIIKNNKNMKENVQGNTNKEVTIEDYIETLEDGTLKNNSKALKTNKQIDELKISNIRITRKENETTIMMDIENMSNKEQGDKNITLVMKDSKGNEIAKIGMNLVKIEASGARTIKLETDEKVINTYDFEILDQELTVE